MSSSGALDVSALPVGSISNAAPLWWGQLILAMIEGAMFLMLVAMYLYIRLSIDVWPPPGTALPHLLMPSLALIPLALSCFGSYWASEGANRNSMGDMLIGMGINVVLGLAFLGMRAAEWHNFNFGWSTDIHGSIVWTILFLHTLDAAADLVFTAALIVILLLHHDTEMIRTGVHVDSVLWYFIAAIWLPLYAAVYWGPRVMGAP